MDFKTKIDLKPSDDFTRVYLSPREISKVGMLRKLVKEKYLALDWKQTPNGLSLDPFDAAQIYPLSFLGANIQPTPEIVQMLKNRSGVLERSSSIKRNLLHIVEGGVTKSKEFLYDVDGLATLDDHQWVNVAGMTLPDSYGLALFDEQGAGKTVSTIFAYDVLVSRDEVDFALIIAPKSMVPEWENDFHKFKGGVYVVKKLTGSRKDKILTLRNGADIFITNYETIIALENEIIALARRYDGRSVLIIDESFFVKNLDAKRTLAIKRAREWFGRTFVLCGTPAPNSPFDIVEQFNIVDFGVAFRGVELPESKEEALPVIQNIIEEKGIYLRHLKKDVLPDLPVKRFQKIFVEMEPLQADLYNNTLRGLISDLETTSDLEFFKNIGSFLAKRMALLRICSNPSGIISTYSESPAKLVALDEILYELIEKQGEKVVLWSFFQASIQGIVSRYQSKYNPVRYDGTISDIEIRRNYVKRFQEDDSTMLFVGNPAAAGAGLTLHRARFAIYESLSNQAAHYLQSLDRIHRRGQLGDVEYLILLCENSIEINEYARLEEKEASGRELLGDGIDKSITRESMLVEAMELIRTLVVCSISNLT